MFEPEELTMFEMNEEKYAIKCDLVVLEKIQDKEGDLLVAEDKLRGFKPRVDSDGVIDRTIGNWTVPDISLVTNSLFWMLEEGRAITEGDYDIPSVDDLKRQDEYTATELALIVWQEFENCIGGRKKKKAKAQAQKKTDIKTQTTKR